MQEKAIIVEDLSKAYRVGRLEDKPKTLVDAVVSSIKAPFKNFRNIRSLSKFGTSDERNIFWALKDLSFDVNHGEVLGIIGRNGAGKSTFLKIISRITDPTSGRITINGRVASLLEVGTGFNLELTGRENVYLNGTILGMKKKEIDSKFDEIIEFSGVKNFIDTPVKRYSSGMKVRLAFAVAAHLDPEILIIDEVLAVGDMEFQQKCIAKMHNVASEGRTVLFVSHQMEAVSSLCTRCIVLREGNVVYNGDVKEAIDIYLKNDSEMAETGIIPPSARKPGWKGEARFTRVYLKDERGIVKTAYYKTPLTFAVELEVLEPIEAANISFVIGTQDGVRVLYQETMDYFKGPMKFEPGKFSIDIEVDSHLLPGSYSVFLGMVHAHGKQIDWVERVYDFTISKNSLVKNEFYRWTRSHGFVLGVSNWKVKALDPVLEEN